MESLRLSLMDKPMVPHCCPSDQEEVKRFMYLHENCTQQSNNYNEYKNINNNTYK